MNSITYLSSPIGELGIVEDGTAVTRIFFGGRDRAHQVCGQEELAERETELLEQAKVQLSEYFSGTRKQFDLPILLAGTGFQKKVWQALTGIPWGETRTYGQIAAAIGNPQGSRAVGMANHRNPIPIVVPCHRVIGAGGSLTGYAGGLDIKRKLLELEGVL